MSITLGWGFYAILSFVVLGLAWLLRPGKRKWRGRLSRVRDGQTLADRVEVAATESRRFLGLMGRSNLLSGHGLWIIPCNSIHMFWMRFDIDAVFVTRDLQVVKIYSHLKPWIGMVLIVFGAHSVFELPAGKAAQISKGDYLKLED